jgi:hypothetical protein
VFYLVPLAGALRKVTNGNRKARFIGQLLQLQFPKAQPRAIAASAVCRDEQLSRLRIQRFTFFAPPPTNGCDRECPGIMVRPNVHEPRVAPQVVNSVWIGAGNIR